MDVPYDKGQMKIKLKDKNLFLFNDNYIVVGKEYERINSTKDMRNIIFGVFEDDAEEKNYTF